MVLNENFVTTHTVPAILTGPMDIILEYSDDLTATFTCTAFGGDGAMLVFTWSDTNSTAGFNTSSQSETLNPNSSTTSTITTNTLTLADRDSEYTCTVIYNSSSIGNEETANITIGKSWPNAVCAHRTDVYESQNISLMN